MKRLLFPLSWIYSIAMRVRNIAFDRRILMVSHAGAPVISVGNMTAGGTGKTPLVQYVASQLGRQGRKVGIVSRGYGRRSRGVVVVSDGRQLLVDAGRGGDEPVQLARQLPGAIVVVAGRRIDAARKARQLGAEVIVADDAFQHRYLHRDLDIVVLDGAVDLAKEPVLPAGRMREPLEGIRRADLLAVAQADRESGTLWLEETGVAQRIPTIRFRHTALPLRQAHDGSASVPEPGRGALAFSGIGNHERFVAMVQRSGVTVLRERRFRDHHRYTDGDMDSLIREMKNSGAVVLVTTEKDVARLSGTPAGRQFMKEYPLWYLPVVASIVAGEELLLARLGELS